MTPDQMDKYKKAFLSESKMSIKALNRYLLALEQTPNDPKLRHNIFRNVHTLKSMSGTMGYNQMMMLCHAIEDLFEEVRDKDLSLINYIDLLFQCLAHLSNSLQNIEMDKSELDSDYLIKKLKKNVTKDPIQK